MGVSTWLFGETVSPPVLNEISDAMVLHEFDAGESLDDLPDGALFVVDIGEVERLRGNVVAGTIDCRNFFAEERILPGGNGTFRYRTSKPSRVYEIPANVIADAPIVMWKILEARDLKSIE